MFKKEKADEYKETENDIRYIKKNNVKIKENTEIYKIDKKNKSYYPPLS